MGLVTVGEEVGSFAYPAKSLEELCGRKLGSFQRHDSSGVFHVESANVHSSALFSFEIG